jgi:SAM-dependent methyltransferase
MISREEIYPAMSHPSADPALAWAAARMVGMSPAPLATSSIVEIGCGTGHHLIALALRWPGATCVGVDIHAESIRRARHLAKLAGAKNVRFVQADIADFDSEPGPHDWIIAHGVLSWVGPDARAALLPWMRQRLAPQGMAIISHNVLAGWEKRMPVIQRARAIREMGAKSWGQALHLLRGMIVAEQPDSPELWVIDDMLAKPPVVLAHDDFGPELAVFSHGQVVAAAQACGLKWIGSPVVSETVPSGLDAESRIRLQQGCTGTVEWLDRVDVATANTFRTSLFCRDDAVVTGKTSTRDLLDLGVRLTPEADPSHDPELYAAVAGFHPDCIAVASLLEPKLPNPPEETVRRVFAAVQQGWLQIRAEEVRFDSAVPARPQLSPFRLACARRRLPLVDLWQVPCVFPATHFDVLAKMDGSLDVLGLVAFASRHAPELNLRPWLEHLAGRGMFLLS